MWLRAFDNDVAIGVLVLSTMSAVLFWLGCKIAQSCRQPVMLMVAAATLAFTFNFAIIAHGRLSLARLLPFSNAIVLANWLPLGTAIVAGIVVCQQMIPEWRRRAVATVLLTLSWCTVTFDLFAETPRAKAPRYWDGVCMQTTSESCSACCAVSLLTEHGITASEQELMGLCFTRLGGTPELGLYRGLKIKTQGTPWDVEVLSTTTEALAAADIFPILLLVDVNPGSSRKSWMPRQPNHAILVHGVTDRQTFAVSDPGAGASTWTPQRLRQCWYGDGLRLVRRDGANSPAR